MEVADWNIMVYPPPAAPGTQSFGHTHPRKKTSLLDTHLKELQENLQKKASKFHVQVSAPGEECSSCHRQKCHSCTPIHHQYRPKDQESGVGLGLGSHKRSSDLNPISETIISSCLKPSVSNSNEGFQGSSSKVKLGFPLYQNLTFLPNQFKKNPANQRSGFDDISTKARPCCNASSKVQENCRKESEGKRTEKAMFDDGKGPGPTCMDDEHIASISGKLSAFKDEIKSFWQGHHSPRQQIELLRQRHESTQEIIQSLEESQQCLTEKILSLEQKTKERNKSLVKMKQERIRSIEQTKEACPNLKEHIVKQRVKALGNAASRPESNMNMCSDTHEMVKITEFWTENNCDFHVNKIVYSLRQVAAYEILEFAHNRLTSHLIGHIYETSNELVDEKKRRSYLRMFGSADENGRLGEDSKPLLAFFLEGTYAELLDFVQQQTQQRKRVKKELLAALKAAEKGLLKEAEREGYNEEDVGDIRWQMTGFKVLERKVSRTKYCIVQSRPNLEGGSVETRDVVEDIMRTTEEGDLGVLERASKLIKLGCYFLERQKKKEQQS